MTLSYTVHFHLAVPDFLSEPWHGEFAQAMDSIDNALWNVVGAAGATVWENDTVYAVGNLVIDPNTGRIFVCIVAHTSASPPATFADDRAAHPGYWATSVLELATQPEAEAGLDNSKFMSPLRVAQAIAAQSPVPGIASEAQALAGTDNTTIMTPLRVNQVSGQTVSATPGGRLTLSSGNPVMAASVTNATRIFYTPHISRILPVWSGDSFASIDFWDELPATLSDATHNPSALTANKVFDWFVSVDGAVVTIAGAPAQVTLTSHGFGAGHPIRFLSDGVLPSPLNKDTTYYVLATGLTANTFLFSTSKAGIPQNVSGGSGVHTLETRRLTHGVAWTNNSTRSAPLSRARGIWLNGAAIANGPALERGTYVGTTYNSTANQLAFRYGGLGLSARFNVWNMYNRVNVGTSIVDDTDSWFTEDGSWHMMNESVNNRAEGVFGLQEDAVDLTLTVMLNGTNTAYSGISMDWQSPDGPALPSIFPSWNSGVLSSHHLNIPPIGFHYWQAIEASGGDTTFYGYVADSWTSGMTFSTRM